MELKSLTEQDVRAIQRPAGEILAVWTSSPLREVRIWNLANPADYPPHENWTTPKVQPPSALKG